MQVLIGIAVSPGVGTGEATVVESEVAHLPNRGFAVAMLWLARALGRMQNNRRSVARYSGPLSKTVFTPLRETRWDVGLVSDTGPMILQGLHSAPISMGWQKTDLFIAPLTKRLKQVAPQLAIQTG